MTWMYVCVYGRIYVYLFVYVCVSYFLNLVVSDTWHQLQPCRQSSVGSRQPHKLVAKYYGPYQIRRRVGEVAYVLDLPPEAKIHPLFHVSQLIEKLGPRAQVS